MDITMTPDGNADMSDVPATLEDTLIEDTLIEDTLIEDTLIEDDTIEGPALEDSALEDDALEDDAIEDDVIEDDMIEDMSIEDDAIEGPAIEDGVPTFEGWLMEQGHGAAQVERAVAGLGFFSGYCVQQLGCAPLEEIRDARELAATRARLVAKIFAPFDLYARFVRDASAPAREPSAWPAEDMREVEDLVLSSGLEGTMPRDAVRALFPDRTPSDMRRLMDASPDLIAMPGGRWIHAENLAGLDEIRTSVGAALRTLFASSGGHCSAARLFEAVRDDLAPLLQDDGIDDRDSLYAVARHLFGRGVAGDHAFAPPWIFELPLDDAERSGPALPKLEDA